MYSAKTFEEFKEILKNHEIETFSKFNIYKNPKGFLDEKREISVDMKLHWKGGLPYFHFGTRMYTCHHGKDKNISKKLKYAEKRKEKAKSIFEKSYKLLPRASKKLDCPASITVTRVFTFPEFKLENPTLARKRTVSEKIKRNLENNGDIEGEEVFWFSLPSVDEHQNHMWRDISAIHMQREIPAIDMPTEISAMNMLREISGIHMQREISAIAEPVDPAVRLKIKQFVHNAKRNTLVISELVNLFFVLGSIKNVR